MLLWFTDDDATAVEAEAEVEAAAVARDGEDGDEVREKEECATVAVLDASSRRGSRAETRVIAVGMELFEEGKSCKEGWREE